MSRGLLSGADAVKRNRHQDNANSSGEGKPDLLFLQGGQHDLTEVASTQERRQHDHGERHHDHLIQAQQDGAARHW